MSRGIHRQSPALFVSLLALFVALSGSVYAATKINGGSIRIKSLPGNRLRLNSVPGNRLAPGAIAADRLRPHSITGAQIDLTTLTQVPNARHADAAESAVDALTSLNSINAVNATTVNGHEAGCLPGTQFFAGACWQSSSSAGAATAPNAAAACASQGGALPEALQLAAFAQQAGVNLDAGDEWSGDIPVFSGLNTYGVVTVSAAGQINAVNSSAIKKYRCVIPLVR
jgi:hypothetical protein